MRETSGLVAGRGKLVAGLAAVVVLAGIVLVATHSGGASADSLSGATPHATAAGAKPPVRASAKTKPAPTRADQRGQTSRSGPLAGSAPAQASPGGKRAVAAPGTVTWRSGAFSGATLEEHKDFASWRGRPLGTALWFTAQDNWNALENPYYWVTEYAKDPRVTPVLSYALWPGSVRGSLAQGATGAYDEHWRTLAKNLVAQGLPQAIIRPGWEFNGDYYPWSLRDDQGAADFAAYWRHLVDAMRSVPGARFEFSWNPVLSGGGVDPAKAYPGDAYVDDIGSDIYNVKLRPELSGDAQWASLVHQRYGLAWQRSFAAAHGKRVSFPEWGAFSRPSDPALAGGDDPGFLRHMFAWMRANPPSYENYFDADTGHDIHYGLHTERSVMPRSAATYRSLWGR